MAMANIPLGGDGRYPDRALDTSSPAIPAYSNNFMGK